MLIYQTRIIVKKSNVLKLRKISKMPPESFMLTFTKLLNMSGMIFFLLWNQLKFLTFHSTWTFFLISSEPSHRRSHVEHEHSHWDAMFESTWAPPVKPVRRHCNRTPLHRMPLWRMHALPNALFLFLTLRRYAECATACRWRQWQGRGGGTREATQNGEDDGWWWRGSRGGGGESGSRDMRR